jgi:hypothetical protein
MFNKMSFWQRKSPIAKDEHLTALLQEWQGIKPGANFEAEVWAKIRHTSQPHIRERVRPSSAWANALAMAAGLVLGVGLAFTAPSTHERTHGDSSLLQTHTLTGSYLALAAGGIR